MKYVDDNVQALALAYVHEIEALRPDGPLVIGGNCQGAVIALAVAEHLLRRRREVLLLALLNWPSLLQHYAGRVLLLFGAEDEGANPFRRYERPEMAWSRHFPNHRPAVIAGRHGNYFRATNVASLAEALRQHVAEAMEAAPGFLPATAYRARIAVKKPPRRLPDGRTIPVTVKVRNTSPVAWPAHASSGLVLATRWLDDTGAILEWRAAAVPLPPFGPGEKTELTLGVTAPSDRASAILMLDLVEEGSTWFARHGNKVVKLAFEIGSTPSVTTPRRRARWVSTSIARWMGKPRGTL